MMSCVMCHSHVITIIVIYYLSILYHYIFWLSVHPFIRSFVRSSRQMLLPRYLMNSFDKTDRKYSLAPLMAWYSS